MHIEHLNPDRMQAWMAVWGQRTNPPTITAICLASLANTDILIEIEAQAVLA